MHQSIEPFSPFRNGISKRKVLNLQFIDEALVRRKSFCIKVNNIYNMKLLVTLFTLAAISIACTSNSSKEESKRNDRTSSCVATSDSLTETLSKDTVTLAFVGDIMPGTTYPKERLPEKDGALLFRDVKAILSRADAAAGNLEGALADTGRTTKEDGQYNYAFRIPTRYGRWLKEAGIDFLSMANNHAFDFGSAGIASTEATLRNYGIAFSGITGSAECAIVQRNGIKFGFCAFGHNPYTFRHDDLETTKRIINDLRKKADIVIVSFHGGAEGTKHKHLPYDEEIFLEEKRGNLRQFAHFCIDNGADVVYGHGPHVVRAVELYNGHFIAYSLGNFCTPYGININGISGYAPVLELHISTSDGTFLNGRIHSFIQQYGRGPRTDRNNLAAKEIRALTASDFPQRTLNISEKGVITRRSNK